MDPVLAAFCALSIIMVRVDFQDFERAVFFFCYSYYLSTTMVTVIVTAENCIGLRADISDSRNGAVCERIENDGVIVSSYRKAGMTMPLNYNVTHKSTPFLIGPKGVYVMHWCIRRVYEPCIHPVSPSLYPELFWKPGKVPR